MEDGEHEAQVDGDGRLAGQERLDPFLDPEIDLIDFVVEPDHLVCELDVGLQEGVQAAAQRPQHEGAFLLERGLELIELFLERDPHPNRPVT